MPHSESVSDLAVQITDLFLKWTKSCKSIEEIRDLMVMEQLLHTLLSEIKVTERKPKMSTEAAEMADNYPRGSSRKTGISRRRENRGQSQRVHGKMAKEWICLRNQR